MKKLLLLCVLASTNIYALDYKILSHSRYTTSNKCAGFTEKVPGYFSMNSLSAHVYTYNVNGSANQDTTVTSGHEIWATNDTDKEQVYSFSYNLSCAGQASGESYQVAVMPHKSFINSVEGCVVVNKDKGYYEILAHTSAAGGGLKDSQNGTARLFVY